ncbi:MAG: ribonuclease D [Coriobacteriia bacterium]|nr:ribonuclease D [Coriobacteriia bacterium]
MKNDQTLSIEYIDSDDRLQEYLQSITPTDLLALDTEFLREKSYYPKLCLLQMATRESLAIIDPLASLDLERLKPILLDPGVVKVFHAGEQDLGILFSIIGEPVTPVFDTQIASQLFGLPQQIGLAALVHEFTGVRLKKIDSFSDWSIRPLKDAQMHYAADDVRYLPQVYQQMVDALDCTGRLHWLESDFLRLSDISHYVVDEDRLWRRLKGNSHLSLRQIGVLREIAIWREHTAQKRNQPRQWVLNDEMLIDIARRCPKTEDELFSTRGLATRINKKSVGELLEAVQRGLTMDEADLPHHENLVPRHNEMPGIYEACMSLVHLRASEQKVTAAALTNSKELRALIGGQRQGLPLLDGWRYEMVGRELLSFLEGNLAMSVDHGQIEVTDRGQTRH